jgi:hypothetical protein
MTADDWHAWSAITAAPLMVVAAWQAETRPGLALYLAAMAAVAFLNHERRRCVRALDAADHALVFSFPAVLVSALGAPRLPTLIASAVAIVASQESGFLPAVASVSAVALATLARAHPAYLAGLALYAAGGGLWLLSYRPGLCALHGFGRIAGIAGLAGVLMAHA